MDSTVFLSYTRTQGEILHATSKDKAGWTIDWEEHFVPPFLVWATKPTTLVTKKDLERNWKSVTDCISNSVINITIDNTKMDEQNLSVRSTP